MIKVRPEAALRCVSQLSLRSCGSHVYAIGWQLLSADRHLSASIPPPVRRFVILIPYVQLIAYVLWMATHDDFRYAIYDYAFTNLSIVVLSFMPAFPVSCECPVADRRSVGELLGGGCSG